MLRLAPVFRQRFFDENGDPLVGGKVHTYEAGTSTPLVSYSDPDGEVENENPVVLDANGEADIFLAHAQYKVVLMDADDVEQWSRDNVNGNLSTGEDGLDGKTLRYGSGAPGPGDGNDGDFYLRTSNWTIYGPKASGAWPAGQSLTGQALAAAASEAAAALSATAAAASQTAAASSASAASTSASGASTSASNAATSATSASGSATTASTQATNAASSASAASTSATNAANSATAADASADAAAVSEANAAASAAAAALTAYGLAKQERLTGTFGSGNTTFTLTQTPKAAQEVLAFLGSVPQMQGTNYTISGVTITFAGEDVSGESLDVFYRY